MEMDHAILDKYNLQFYRENSLYLLFVFIFYIILYKIVVVGNGLCHSNIDFYFKLDNSIYIDIENLLYNMYG